MASNSKRTPRTRVETQQSLSEVRQNIAARPALGQQDLTEQRRRAAAAVEGVKEVDLQRTMQKFTQAGLDVQKLLSQVQGTFSEQYTEVQTLRDAVEAYRAEFEDLFGKDVIASDLQDVLAAHDQRISELTQQYRDAQAEHARKVTELVRLETETKANIERRRVQEESDYNFRRDQQRRTEEAQYAETRREEERELAQREADIGIKETEFIKLKDEVAAFPELLKKEVAKAEAIVGNTVKRDLTNAFALEKKDQEAKIQLLNAENQNLRAQVVAVEARNTQLQQQISDANMRIESISKAALDSASGQRALTEMREFVATQGTSAPTNRRG